MNELSNRIYETPEFKSLDEVKLTLERARFYAAHAVYFNMNRRDCWGTFKVRSPGTSSGSSGSMKKMN